MEGSANNQQVHIVENNQEQTCVNQFFLTALFSSKAFFYDVYDHDKLHLKSVLQFKKKKKAAA
jgi:hypothetical protein